MSVLQRPAAQLSLLAAVATLLLAPGLAGDFVWDDKRLVVDSPHIEDLGHIPTYFATNLQQGSGDEGRAADGIDIYRPLYLTALSLLAQIDGRTPFPFHVALLAAHLLASALLWLLVRTLVPDSGALGAAFAFLAFALHPVTAESGLWISALSEPMAAIGLFGTVWLLSDRPTRRQSLLAGAVFFAGLLSKEVIIMALPPITLWLIVRGVSRRTIAPLWIASGLMMGLRFLALGGMQGSGAGSVQRWDALANLGFLWWHGFGALLTHKPIGPIHLYFTYTELPGSGSPAWSRSSASAESSGLCAVEPPCSPSPSRSTGPCCCRWRW